MLTDPSPPDTPPPGLPLPAAAGLQAHLRVASEDLDRLQRLLAHAGESLTRHFQAAAGELEPLLHIAARYPQGFDGDRLHVAMAHLAGAITAMQFQDLAAQLVGHTERRLRDCADQLALEALGDDDDEGPGVVAERPLRPNPVTQDAMDAGSIELF